MKIRPYVKIVVQKRRGQRAIGLSRYLSTGWAKRSRIIRASRGSAKVCRAGVLGANRNVVFLKPLEMSGRLRRLLHSPAPLALHDCDGRLLASSSFITHHSSFTTFLPLYCRHLQLNCLTGPVSRNPTFLVSTLGVEFFDTHGGPQGFVKQFPNCLTSVFEQSACFPVSNALPVSNNSGDLW